MSNLHAEKITLQYGQRRIISNLSLSFTKPEIVTIIGPNGSGKSTLLKALCRLLMPTSGAVYLNGKELSCLPTEEVAKVISVMAQSAQAPVGITVEELVRYGRLPYQKFFDGLSSQDNLAVESAIGFTELGPLRQRQVITLSGGERQRVWLAMALAQQPQILLLDEPTTYLDIHHQLELMELVVRLNKELGVSVIMVLHDLNHAARYSQRLIAIKDGCIMADGPTEKVFCTEVIEELYNVHALVTMVEARGQCYPMCFPFAATEHE